tara:strand:+ start:574 stop:789 length:216 start_codon:yes stop_codon:yes gene_type:complete
MSKDYWIPTRRVISKNKVLIGFKITELNQQKSLSTLLEENAYCTNKGLTYFDEEDLSKSLLEKLTNANGYI